MNNYKVIGVNDDTDFCECCGKTNLKKVVWIEDTETGDIKHFGTTCAQNPIKGFDKKIIKAEISKYESALNNRYRKAHHLYRKQGGKYEGSIITGAHPVNQALFQELFESTKI